MSQLIHKFMLGYINACKLLINHKFVVTTMKNSRVKRLCKNDRVFTFELNDIVDRRDFTGTIRDRRERWMSLEGSIAEERTWPFQSPENRRRGTWRHVTTPRGRVYVYTQRDEFTREGSRLKGCKGNLLSRTVHQGHVRQISLALLPLIHLDRERSRKSAALFLL